MKPQGFSDRTARLQEWQRKATKNIKEHGRTIIAVTGDPEFAYTLGNCITQDTAEVISFYPSQPTMKFVLNNFSDDLKAGNIPDLCESEPAVVYGMIGKDGELPIRARLLTAMERVIAYEKYTCQLPSVTTPVAIIDLPDPNGHFADSDECDPYVREMYEQQPFKAKLQ